jgi:ATP-dependent DNA ligase
VIVSPSQILSTRARKGVTINDIKVSVCTFGFDILYVNGKPLLQEQLKVRREVLYSYPVDLNCTIHFVLPPMHCFLYYLVHFDSHMSQTFF